MPPINGIVSASASESICSNHNLQELHEQETVIRWNLTCWHNNLKGTGVAE